VAVMNAIKVLALVEEANQMGRKLPPEAFYNELISEKLDVLDHYVAWRQTHDMPQHSSSVDGPFSFCSYPFLLNPRAKSKLLHTEARIQMDQTVADARAAHQAGRPDEEERVVPNTKQTCGSSSGSGSNKNAQQPSTSTGSGSSGGILGNSRRRRDRGTSGDVSSSGSGLRWLLGRHGAPSPSAAAVAPSSSAQDTEVSSTSSGTLLDDRYPTSASATLATSPMRIGASVGAAAAAAAAAATTDAPSGNAQQHGHQLWKQGSLGLPTPDNSGFPATHPEMCILRVRRGHLLEDALNEVARQRPRDLFKPLRVHFIGEDGVDAGGVKKEFFQLLLEKLLCPDYGMLVHQDESNTYWFSPSTMEADDEFLLLGLVVGLSVYNGVLLDLPLPLALYRKVLGQEVRLRDLEDMQPTLGRSLRSLLQYEGPEPMADVFCQTFTVEMQVCGETQTVELTPGGEDILVTEDNRREFVEAYVHWWLNGSIHRQFEAFAKGFLMLCGGPALQLFSATELERLVCGSPCLDFDALVRSARYEGGYHPEHRVVQWLWQVVSDLTPEEKKMFLKFFTGSDRAPIGGLANLRVIIQRDGADSTKLPTSHTCFNTLLLPSYRSKEKLEDRLKLAILNAEGFGLE
jgi:ubiquitin-protein ligase E3 A